MKRIKNSWQGIEGVSVFDTGQAWPSVGIVGLVHGNEHVALKIFDLVEDKLLPQIKKWKLFFIVANLLALEQNKRLVDHNLNRIWNKPFEDKSYEFRRREELKKVLDQLDVVLDIHSVSQWDNIMAIGDIKDVDTLKEIFDVPWILVNDMSKWWSLIAYMISKGKKWFAVEVGNHDSEQGVYRWFEFVKSFLTRIGLIGAADTHKHQYNPKVLRFLEEIYPTSENFEFAQKFETFTYLKKWEVYAYDGDKVFEAPQDVWIWLVSKKIEVGDGAGFLFVQM